MNLCCRLTRCCCPDLMRYFSSMEIDSPSSPRDRIVQRILKTGVPAEVLSEFQCSLVAFVKNNPVSIPELVSAILPSNEEFAEALSKSKEEGGSIPKDRFREHMIWLQWLIFGGDPRVALKNLAIGQRGVCGAVWGHSDIAYRCRTCEHDPTCAICVPCFQNGNHEGHDYSVIYTTGGCCDCGDVTAWKREGFCVKHKGAEHVEPLPEVYADSAGPVFQALLNIWREKLLRAESVFLETSRGGDVCADIRDIANELTLLVVEMLLKFCKHSESLLSFVSRKVYSVDHLLDILVSAERHLSEAIVKKLHQLLLKLLGDPMFKYEFAKVFLKYYPTVIDEAVREYGDLVFKKFPLVPTFAVQILTVPTLTPSLVKELNVISMLLGCLERIFSSCAGKDGRVEVTKWGNIYETTLRVVEDIRFVISHGEVRKYVTENQQDVLRTWIRLLGFLQGMDPQKRETGLHVEEESENIQTPFILCHSIAMIHSLLVAEAFSSEGRTEGNFSKLYRPEMLDGDGLRHAKVGRISKESFVSSAADNADIFHSLSKLSEVNSNIASDLVPSSALCLTFECLRGIESWLEVDNPSESLLKVFSPTSGIMLGSNFLDIKKTLSKIRKGKYIFGRVTQSSELSEGKTVSSNRSGMSFDSSMMSEEVGSVGEDNPEALCSSMEEEPATDSNILRLLSSSEWPEISFDVSSQHISIHLPLHRLLSLILQNALKQFYGESLMTKESSSHSASPFPESSFNFFRQILSGCHPHGFSAFLMEHPLRVRVFCAQVRAGMWRKNGDAPLISWELYRANHWSHQCSELDLFLLQCCAALAPADPFAARIVERFGLSNYLSLNLEQPSEYEPVLVQEMLTLLIQIVAERRFCGLSTSQSLRRELVHKLATGDFTHSHLVKSLPRDLAKNDQLQGILDGVAVYSDPSGLNQGKYSLQLSCWKELDLYHPRWNPRDLQIAEERYLRFCGVSAQTTQLPRWTKIHQPLNGITRLATGGAVLRLVRAVLYYAAFTVGSSLTRAPDGVLLTALHLLSLGLEICSLHRDIDGGSLHFDDSIPLLALAGENIGWSVNSFCEESLLSVLVLLMRNRKKDAFRSSVEVDNIDISTFIGELLKKFAELDSGCKNSLQKLAPELVNDMMQTAPGGDANSLGSASDGDKRKAKARERQAAIMEKMKAQQSKFLASISSIDDEPNDSRSVQGDLGNSEVDREEEYRENACSLCHDPNSKRPVSFLIFLQKSRLVSFVDNARPSWDSVTQSDGEQAPVATSEVSQQFQSNTSPSWSSTHPQLMHLVQNAVNELGGSRRSREINEFLDSIGTRVPSARTVQLPSTLSKKKGSALHSFDSIEVDMYFSIWEEVKSRIIKTQSSECDIKLPFEGISKESQYMLLGKYIASLSTEKLENLSASSEDALPGDSASESNLNQTAVNGFKPADCDGIYLSSCGHAVHRGCRDRYLSSLKERYSRRVAYEGGHIVDPDQGEFLCPVCRRLANSILPVLPKDIRTGLKQSIPTVSSADMTGPLGISAEQRDIFHVQQALFLLESTANMVGRPEVLESLPLHKYGELRSSLEPVLSMLYVMYSSGKKHNYSGPTRVSHSPIMWDTLKYSLVSTEISARSSGTQVAPSYCIDLLFKELKASDERVLSLLLKIVDIMRSNDPNEIFLRFRGVQLFAESVCCGYHSEEPLSSTSGRGDLQSIFKQAQIKIPYPDILLWEQASDPVLSHDPFSSLMWVLFCLPSPFLACKSTFMSLVHVFYVVSVAQAIMTYVAKSPNKISESGFQDCMMVDISKVMGESGPAHYFFASNHINPSFDIDALIRFLSFPYLRRCALLSKLLSLSFLSDIPDRSASSDEFHDMTGLTSDNDSLMQLKEIKKLENMFMIPSLDIVVKDRMLRSLVLDWFHHFRSKFGAFTLPRVLHSTPAVPFRLMRLPHIYQDLLQRFFKRSCPFCKSTLPEPALCLLCGRLCSPIWKSCCRKSGSEAHALSCGAGTGVYLLIRKTTILLQRSARQSLWPSPYLDAFGEEDVDLHRGKLLYLNEERYAALCYMVASHGLDQSTKVLHRTMLGNVFVI